MKLSYNVVWMEDQPHNVQPHRDGLKINLERKGVELFVREISNFGDPNGTIRALRRDQDNIDLVLLDWNLGQAGGRHAPVNGSTIARKVRANIKYTDIIFYSTASASELRRAVADEGVDGVYCCHRDELVTVCVGMAMRSMRKNLGLNSLRGAYVVKVTELDYIVKECITRLYDKMNPEEKLSFITSIVRRLRSSAQSMINGLERIDMNDLGSLMGSRAFGSDQKISALLDGLDLIEHVSDYSHYRDTLNTYRDDILTPRNIFAHQSAKYTNERLRFEDEYILDNGKVEILRSRLLAHEINLNSLIEAFQQSS